MTDAYVPVKTEKSHEESIITKNNNETRNNTDPISLKEDANCNITNDFNPTQNVNMLTLHIAANTTSEISGNNNKSAIQDCTEDSNDMSDECLKKITKLNEIPDSDSVLKYIYKKNEDKSAINKKSFGHPLNRLRKKRAVTAEASTKNITPNVYENVTPATLNTDLTLNTKKSKALTNINIQVENIAADASENLPLIVNYETDPSPGGKETNNELPAYQRQTENTIKNSALADFNIETLHDNTLKKEESENSSSRSQEESNENSNKSVDDRNENQSYSDESSEERNRGERTDSPDIDHAKISKHENSGQNKEHNSSSNEESHEESDDTRKNEDESSETPYHRSNDNLRQEKYIKNSISKDDSSELSEDDRDNSEKLQDSYDHYENHPRKPVNNFEQYDDNPRKTEGSFEKYDVNPRKPIGSFEKYEEKEYSPPNKDRFSETDNDLEKTKVHKKYSDSSKSIKKSDESDEARDSVESNESEKSHYTKKPVSNYNIDNSQENTKPNHNTESSESHEGSEQSHENSSENHSGVSHPEKDKLHSDYQKKPKDYESYVSTPSTIQGVDLGDFSFERVHVDDKGQITPARDSEDNDSATFKKPISNLKTDNKSQIAQIESPEIDEQLKSEIYESIKQPIRINGEIKPVVEINNENSDAETSDENSKEALRSNSGKNSNLDTTLIINEKDEDDRIEQSIDKNKSSEMDDIKQQFERIPTDYKHENRNDENKKHSQETQSEENAEEVQNEGTLDTFSPKDVKYDENLKFKFDDISIKLPEIKLPEDILAYTYEEPSYAKNRKNKPKDKFYHYSDEEDVDDNPTNKKKDDKNEDNNDHDHEYYHYYEPNKNAQIRNNRKDAEEEDEDLYEKFVRERFGKKGSFEKRSEKLQIDKGLPYNPKLYETVQNILKKTVNIDKEAKNSGDPNAGYQWTLEYGENLK